MPQNINDEEVPDYTGDTIIVKGEFSWPRPISPGNMSAQMDVNNLHFAQIDETPRNLESPDLETYGDNTSTQNPPTDPQPHAGAQRTPKSRQRLVATTMEDRLMAMPQRRELPWRDNVEPGAENETGGESRRKQIRFGCLLATRGDIQEVPCNSCANGRGKFSVCVALDGYFKGACASCQLSGRPNRCSIKKNDDGAVAGSPTLNPPAVEDLSPFRHSEHLHPSSLPEAKRRKTDTVPEWESARPQWEQELGESHARQQMNEIVQRPPWATVNSPAAMSTPHQMMNGLNGSRPPGSNEHRNSLGWAPVNQPVPLPGTQPFGSAGDAGSSNHRANMEQSRREETIGNEDGSVALIDTLPKNKQRQIYGIVSGLAGGIEHLQRELDSLKRALGIDDED